jgi:predicted extracellular nuclease
MKFLSSAFSYAFAYALVATMYIPAVNANIVANNSGVNATIALGQCNDPATLISAIQGDTAISPFVNEQHVVEGIVSASFESLSGFFVQEEDVDMDDNAITSEGVFVRYTEDPLPEVGQVVRALGTVSEFFNKTQLTASEVLGDCGTATASVAELTLPFESVLAAESLEGMLVSATQTLVVTDNFTLGRFGEVTLSSKRIYTPTSIYAPGSDEAIELAAENALDKITLDDGNNTQNPEIVPFPTGDFSASNTLRIGDTVSTLTGVVDYSFNEYRVIPTIAPTFVATNERTNAPDLDIGNVTIASLNVLNYFIGLDANGNRCGPDAKSACRGADNETEFERQKAKTVAAIVSMDADIVGLMEIENNGYGEGSAIKDLVAGINAEVGEGTYAMVESDGPIGTDAIKVAMIYKPTVVSLDGDMGILYSDNSIIDNTGPLFDDGRNRPAIAQRFSLVENGEMFVVSVNHFKSKGSSCGLGDDDATTGQGNCNLNRTRAAQALSAFLTAEFGDAPTLIIGDLNAYAKEDPIAALEMAGYTNLINAFNGAEAYTYSFNGELGYLDHALANQSALEKTVDVTLWHINADEPTALDYNTEFKSEDQIIMYYATDAYRMSDHDPVLISLALDGPQQETAKDVIEEVKPSSGGSLSIFGLVLLTAVYLRRNAQPLLK